MPMLNGGKGNLFVGVCIVEGVHLGTDADAHSPHENTVFAQKMWKGVPKTPPRTTRVHEKETTTTNSTI